MKTTIKLVAVALVAVATVIGGMRMMDDSFAAKDARMNEATSAGANAAGLTARLGGH